MERLIEIIVEQLLACGIAFAVGCLLGVVYLVGTGDIRLHTL